MNRLQNQCRPPLVPVCPQLVHTQFTAMAVLALVLVLVLVCVVALSLPATTTAILAVKIRHATHSTSSSSRLTVMQTRRATAATKGTSAAVAPPAPTTPISAQTVLWTGIRDNIRGCSSRGSNRYRCTLLDTICNSFIVL
jgi:predicted S18 family serine protease